MKKAEDDVTYNFDERLNVEQRFAELEKVEEAGKRFTRFILGGDFAIVELRGRKCESPVSGSWMMYW